MITAGEVGKIPVVIDGPLSLSATELYRRHKGCYDDEAVEQLARGDHPLDMDSFLGARDGRQSSRVSDLRGPAIIIAGSGMCNGGRIRKHLAENLEDPRTDVLLVGYQGARTLGRALEDGEREVYIDERTIPVRARITATSLESWLATRRSSPLGSRRQALGRRPTGMGVCTWRVETAMGRRRSAAESET